MGYFKWEDLDLPEYESPEETLHRLEALHKETLKEKGLSTRPEKNSPGFRPSAVQAREVAVMSCLGLSSKDIALTLNIEEKLLKLYYAKELKVSANLANMMVAKRALEMAVSGRYPDMTKFWLKARANWRETAAMELSGPNGGPLEITSAKDKLAGALAAGKGVK